MAHTTEEQRRMEIEKAQELELALETALMMNPKTPIPILAERLYDSETDLVEFYRKPWMVDRFKWLLYRHKQRAAIKAQSQEMPGYNLTLPGCEGIEKLPIRITLKNGKRPELRSSTLAELKQFRAVLLARRDARIKVLDCLIALVAEYATQNQKITVADVIAAERKKQEWKP
jgi:hypothetical protein